MRLISAVRSDAGRVCLAVMLLNASDGLVTTIASPYLQHLGFSIANIGLLVSVYAVAALISRVPSGRFAEGSHARRWFVLSSAVFALALASYPVATAAWSFALVRATHGLAFGAASTLNFAAFLTISAGGNRGRSTVFFTSAMSAGYSLGNFTSGLLADHFGYTTAFLFGAACPLASLLVAPPLRLAHRAMPHEPSAVGLWAMLRHPDVRAVPILAFCLNFFNSMLGTLFPLYALSVGQTLAFAGVARGLQSTTNTVMRPVAGPLARRLGTVGLGCAALALVAVGLVAIPLTAVPVVLLGLIVLAGAGRAAGVLANAVQTVDLSERRIVKGGTASALISAGGDVGSIAAPIVAGAVAAWIGIGGALQTIAVATAIVGIATLLGSRAHAEPAATTG